MTTHVPINIYEYRLGNAPEGFWRYIYDRYASGKPVDEASDTQGRAVFAAYRTHAPGTVPIYLHRYTLGEPEDSRIFDRFTTDRERTPSYFELDEQFSGSDRTEPEGQIAYRGNYIAYGAAVRRKLNGSTRAFWAFPASSGADVPAAVPVYEHRLELDFQSQDLRPWVSAQPIIFGNCATYIKYSMGEIGGRVFNDREDAKDLSTPSAWWRSVTIFDTNPSTGKETEYAYARYTRKIAFYAFPAQ